MQMCIIYASTFLSKLSGPKWMDGTALYYIVQLDDVYGKWFHPSLLFGYMGPLKVLTWGTLLIEGCSPLALWYRPTRRAALISVTLLHLGIDLSMNLGAFHWIMILGFLSFLVDSIEFTEEEEQEEDAKAPATSSSPNRRKQKQKKRKKTKQS